MKFDNVVTLFGMPRSGTTIISRLIANHSLVRVIIEPYHTRRELGYREMELRKLCADFDVSGDEDCSLLVKETFTRVSNMTLLSELIDATAANGLRAAYIFVLRSPLECFLSQVEASSSLWAKATNFGHTEKSLKSFWNTFCESIKIYLGFANRFHRRFIVYDRFVRHPTAEIGTAMGLFGYLLERSQMNLTTEAPTFGGDPKARARFSDAVPDRDHFRVDAVARMSEKFGPVPEFRSMQSMHALVKRLAIAQSSSEEIIRDLSVLVHRGFI